MSAEQAAQLKPFIPTDAQPSFVRAHARMPSIHVYSSQQVTFPETSNK